jgi:hypothetical protein
VVVVVEVCGSVLVGDFAVDRVFAALAVLLLVVVAVVVLVVPVGAVAFNAVRASEISWSIAMMSVW